MALVQIIPALACTPARISEDSEKQTGSQRILILPEKDLKYAQIKLTYIGDQTIRVPTVLLTINDTAIPVEKYASIQLRGQHYGNDKPSNIIQCSVTLDEYKAIVKSISPIISMSVLEERRPFISFVMMLESNTVFIGCEFRVGQLNAEKLYSMLFESMKKSHKATQEALHKQYDLVIPESERGKVKDQR
jgi:hypothetical protein